MLFLNLLILALGSAGFSTGAAVEYSSVKRQLLEDRQRNAAGNNGTCLANFLIQSASNKTGQEPGTVGIKPGQSPSARYVFFHISSLSRSSL